jgi:hypothetical protein
LPLALLEMNRIADDKQYRVKTRMLLYAEGYDSLTMLINSSLTEPKNTGTKVKKETKTK